MAFWKKKRIKDGLYYYIYESYYEDGKSKQRMVDYVGTIEDVLALAMDARMHTNHSSGENGEAFSSEQEEPLSFDADELRIKSYAHGDCMAMFLGAKLLDLQGILDECFPPKMIKGLPRSTVLILAMIHRAIDPGSKRQFAGWVNTTSLPYYLHFQAADLDSQAFWEAMDGITDEMIKNAWNKIVAKMESLFGILPSIYHLDYSNYFTFIDTKNGRCLICKLGHNKQKRDDLRQFSLAVLTSAELQIPIVWELYDGNTNDKTEFAAFIKNVSDTLTEMGRDISDITVVLDGGSNSEENFSGIKFHIVCPDSLRSHKELYDISVDDYEEIVLSNGSKRLAKRVDNLTFCGIQGVGILTFSQELLDGKVKEQERDLQKLNKLIEEMNSRLSNPRSKLFTDVQTREGEIRREAKEAVEYNENLKRERELLEAEGKKVKGKPKQPKEIPTFDYDLELLHIVEKHVFQKEYLKEFVSLSLEKTDDVYHVSINIDKEKEAAYIKKYYGKKLTCTDHTEWSTIEILDRYGDQECIENSIFRVSKDTDHFAIRPQFHWTDPKIKVHVFCCLAAITIAEALRMKCEQKGFHMTKAVLLDRLHSIRDAWVSYKGKKLVRKLEEIEDPEIASLWEFVSNLLTDIEAEASA